VSDESKPDPKIPTSGGEEQEPPPPFEPDEELITYLERGRNSKGEKR